MALTKNGKRTGRAGALDLLDFRKEMFENALAQAQKNREDFISALDSMKSLDPDGWSKWYDEFVPDWLNGWLGCRKAIDVMEARVNELLSNSDLGARFAIVNGDVMELDWKLRPADGDDEFPF